MGSASRTGTLMVALSAICFGSLSVFARHLSLAGVAVPTMLAYRFAGGALVLWLFAWRRGELRRLTFEEWRPLVVLGALYVAEAWIYFESAKRIPVALTALLLYLYPALVAVLVRILFKDRLGTGGVIALVLSLTGVALAVGGVDTRHLDGLGVGLGALTAVIYSAYVLIAARIRPTVPSSLSSAWLMTIAALGFAMAARGTTPPVFTTDLALNLGGLVVLGTALPIPLLLSGLARIGPTRGSIVSSIEPLSAAVLGAWLLGESLGLPQLAGIGLVVAAIVLLARRG